MAVVWSCVELCGVVWSCVAVVSVCDGGSGMKRP